MLSQLRTNALGPVAVLFLGAVPLGVTFYLLQSRRRSRRTPTLKGPPGTNIVLGVAEELFSPPDLGAVYESWERTYGQVYQIPSGLGTITVILGDPKAMAHVLSNDTTLYVQHHGAMVRKLFGDILLVMEGETHKRQRRALSPAFSISAIRSLTDVFVNSFHKLQSQWDQLLETGSNGSITVDVQKWMDYISLDSIGNGGFSHDFGALMGHQSAVQTAFDSFGSLPPSTLTTVLFLVASRFPGLFSKVPSERTERTRNLIQSIREIAGQLLDKVEEKGEKEVNRSMIGTLFKSEHASEKIRMSIDEIMAQNLLLLAGYETTAVSLTWALIELSRNPDIQDKLRAELRDHLNADQDPTYDQVQNSLPYLDAFTSEILRLHPALPEITRMASCDDTIPLTEPIITASGTRMEDLFVSKGTFVRIPIAGVNRSEILWGKDAGKFDPGRWLSESGDSLKEFGKDGDMDLKDAVQGYRHLLTFAFGPRMCLGRNFALTEFKIVLSLLVRRYRFAFPGGPETKLESQRSILLRPKVVGEDGPRVPLVIRKVEE